MAKNIQRDTTHRDPRTPSTVAEPAATGQARRTADECQRTNSPHPLTHCTHTQTTTHAHARRPNSAAPSPSTMRQRSSKMITRRVVPVRHTDTIPFFPQRLYSGKWQHTWGRHPRRLEPPTHARNRSLDRLPFSPSGREEGNSNKRRKEEGVRMNQNQNPPYASSVSPFSHS